MPSATSPRIALVTGAGHGIGRACALALHAEGWSVVLSGRRKEALEDAAHAAKPGPGGLLVHPADVTNPDSVNTLFAATRAEFGRLDLLFNNAGIFTPAAPFDETPLDDWRASLDTNLTGAFLCAREAFRLMKAQSPQGGRILNNGSVSAQVPRPHAAPYTVSKHGLNGLTKQIALEGRAFNIACSQIDIGNAATDMTQSFASGALQADGTRKQEARMDVADVARIVVAIAGLPPSVNIPAMTLMATAMPFIGRG